MLDLVKAFLKAGILGEDRVLRETSAGTPQGSILSPLMSNVALSVLDEYVAQAPGGPAASVWERRKRRSQGLPNNRLSRYADDWCLMVHGTKADAQTLQEEIAGVLSTMGLRLSEEKTLITHIDRGLDFLGWRIQRQRKPGTNRYYVYTYPAKKALRAVMAKVKTLCRQVGTNQPLDALLRRLNPALQGWCAYFRLLRDAGRGSREVHQAGVRPDPPAHSPPGDHDPRQRNVPGPDLAGRIHRRVRPGAPRLRHPDRGRRVLLEPGHAQLGEERAELRELTALADQAVSARATC